MKRAKQQLLKAPRNPFVAAVLFKKSGAHGKSEKALRREQKIQLRQTAHEE